MVLIHIPRVIASFGKGLIQYYRRPNHHVAALNSFTATGPDNPHIYHARAGIFDIDYLGHMNNAAYLSHAEYARWEFTASSGLLHHMVKNKTNFVVGGAVIRYRRDIRPLFEKFQIDSYIGSIDERKLYVYQTFRLPIKGDDRVRVQVMVQGILMHGRDVVNPMEFLETKMGVNPNVLNSWYKRHDNNIDDKEATTSINNALIQNYEDLESTLRQAAAQDDQRRRLAK